MAYDTLGYIDTETVAIGGSTISTTDYDFDATGALRKLVVKDGADNTLRSDEFEYAPDGIPILSRNGLGVETHSTYNTAGLLTKLEEAKGATFHNRFLNNTTHGIQQTTTYQYYADGSLKKETLPDGTERRYYSDPLFDTTDGLTAQWVSITGVAGESTASVLDVNDDPTATSIVTDQVLTTRTNHDKVGRVVQEKNLLYGGETSYAYEDPRLDLPTRVTSEVVTLLQNDDATTSCTQAVNVFAYDAYGNLLFDKSGSIAGDEDTVTATARAYDELGNLVSSAVIMGYGTQRTFKTAPTGKVVEQHERGRASFENETLVTEFVYDEQGRLRKTTDPLVAIESGADSATVTYSVDSGMVKIESKSREGFTTAVWVDAAGQTRKERNQYGGETEYSYDLAGNLTDITTPAYGDLPATHTEFQYDGLNRQRVTIEHGTSSITTYVDYMLPAHTVAHWDSATTDAAGNVTATIIDSLGNPVATVTNSNAFTASPVATPLTGEGVSYTTSLVTLVSYAYFPAEQFHHVTTMLTAGDEATPTGPLTIDGTYDQRRVSHLHSDNAGRTLRTENELRRDDGKSLHVYYGYNSVGNLTVAAQVDNDNKQLLRTEYTNNNSERYVHSKTIGFNSSEQPTDADNSPEGSTVFNSDGTIHASWEKREDYDGLPGGDGLQAVDWVKTEYEYDELGRISRTMTPDPTHGNTANTATVETHYDGNVRTTVVLRNGTSISMTTEEIYDYASQRTTTRTTVFGAVNDAGAAISTFNEIEKKHNPNGSIKEYTDTTVSDYYSVEYVYDSFGRIVQQQTNDASTGASATTTYGYDAVGNLAFVKDAKGNVTGYEYDTLGRLVYEYLDEDGGCVTSPDGNDRDSGEPARHYVYDIFGQRIEKTDRNGVVITYGYNSVGQLTSETCASESYAASFAYTIFGELETTVDNHSEYAYEYTPLRQVDKIQFDHVSGDFDTSLDYTYYVSGTVAGVATSIGEVLDNTTTYGYDPIGRIEQITQTGASAEPKTVRFRYDFGVTRTGELGPVTLDYRYDAASAISSDLVGGVYRVDYPDGNAARIEHRNDQNAAFDQCTLDYYANGLLYHRTSQSDGTSTCSYDGKSQLTNVDSTVDTADEAFAYDEAGNKKEYTVVDSYNRLLKDRDHYYAYDDEGNLTEKWTLGVCTTGDDHADSNRSLQTTSIELTAGKKYEFSFDDVEITDEHGSLGTGIDFTMFTEVIATISILDTGFSETFTMPATYFYNSLKIPRSVTTTSEDRIGFVCQPADAGLHEISVSFFVSGIATALTTNASSSFDVITPQSLEVFEWDHRDRLISVKTYADAPGAATTQPRVLSRDTTVRIAVELDNGELVTNPAIEYTYDVFDQLITQSITIEGAGTETNYFAHDRGNRVLALRDNAGTVTLAKRTLWNPQGDGQVLANEENGITYWTLTDEQNTVRNVVYKTGSHHAEHVTYDVFGDPDLSATYLADKPGIYHIDQFFHGRTLDWNTGLYYDGARWYDPVTQRFISEDNAGYDPENLYLYRNNNPNDSEAGGFFDNHPNLRDWIAGMSDPMMFAGVTVVAVVGGITGGTAIAPAVTPAVEAYGVTVVVAGGTSAAVAGAMQARAANPNANWSEYTLSSSMGGLSGLINPIGGFADLGGTLAGGGAQWLYDGQFFGKGMQAGGLIGGIVGSAVSARLARDSVRCVLAWEGGGVIAGGAAGAAYYGNTEGALLGANLGMMAGGIAHSVTGIICFVAGTPVVVGADQPALAAANVAVAATDDNRFNTYYTLSAGALLAAGWLAYDTLEQRKRRKQEQLQAAADSVFDSFDDELDPPDPDHDDQDPADDLYLALAAQDRFDDARFQAAADVFSHEAVRVGTGQPTVPELAEDIRLHQPHNVEQLPLRPIAGEPAATSRPGPCHRAGPDSPQDAPPPPPDNPPRGPRNLGRRADP